MTQYKEDLTIIFNSLSKVIYSNPSNNIRHYTYYDKKRKSYYTKLIFTNAENNSKFYRDELIKILIKENVEFISSKRMKLIVDTKDFISKLDNLLVSSKAINKFEI